MYLHDGARAVDLEHLAAAVSAIAKADLNDLGVLGRLRMVAFSRRRETYQGTLSSDERRLCELKEGCSCWAQPNMGVLNGRLHGLQDV